MQHAFFVRDGDHFVPTWATRGPWDEDSQHGGPPTALLTQTLLGKVDLDQFSLARITADFLRPVPLAPLTIQVESVRVGRTVQRHRARLIADRPVLEVNALFIRQTPGPVSAEDDDPWPDPDDLDPFTFPFFPWEEGYHKAIDLRVAGGTWGTTPVRFWTRPNRPLVLGEPTAPEARVVLIADAESGLGPPLDPDKWVFANPDLTVVFSRRPTSGWLGFDVRSWSGGAGTGISTAAIHDEIGRVARSIQSLVVGPRP